MNDLEKALESVPETTQPQEQAPVEQLQEIVQNDQAADQITQPAPESSTDRNFKAMRELRAKAERERDEAMRRAAELEARLTGFQPQQEAAPEFDDINIGNDDLVEGKHVKQLTSELRKLRAEVKQQQQQSMSSLVEARLKMEYPDIEKVVTKENIEILGIQEPDIAATINDSQDLYKKAVAAYKLIKKFGIQHEDNYSDDRARAQTNAAKPRPLTSVSPQQGDSPLSHANAFANGLTDELKASLLKEMMNARR